MTKQFDKLHVNRYSMKFLKPITKKLNQLLKMFGGTKMNSDLMSSILSYLVVTPIDAILYYQWINTLQDYTWIAGAVFYPLFGFLYFLIPTLVARHKKYLLKKMENSNYISSYFVNKFNYYIEEITDEQINYPKLELVEIGSMDSLGSILGALSTPFISIMLNVIVSKLTLPMTMLASYIFLNKHYKKNHYFGVTTTLFGIMVAAIPKLYMGNTETHPIWLMLFICSLIPSVASYIIKELYLTRYTDANSWYMNSVISVFQIGFGLLSLALLKLPIPSFQVEDMGKYIGDAIKCQFGNTEIGEQCKYSLLYMLAFQIFGTIANILMFNIIRKGSSVTFIMVNTIKTPITAIMGFVLICFRVITYTNEQKFVITWLDIVSLILILIGAMQYTSQSEKTEISEDYKLLNTKEVKDDSDEENEIVLNQIVKC